MPTGHESVESAAREIFETTRNENCKIIASRLMNDAEFRVAFCMMMTKLIRRYPQLLEDLIISLSVDLKES